MEGQCEDDLLLIEEVDFEEVNDESVGNLADAREAEAAADRIMAEEDGETKSLEATAKTDTSNPEPDGKQETEPALSEAPVKGFNYAVGRLIRLVRPAPTQGRVDEVVFEFMRGKFVSWNLNVKSSCIYVMGFNMAKANLGRYLEYGEKCIIKYKHNQKRITSITLWIGPANVKPMMPSTHPPFRNWLTRKGMSIKDFSAWIKNSTDPVPFCHWEEDIYAGNVINMFYDEANVAIGALLKLKLLYRKVNEVPLDDFSSHSFVYLPREDFFVWGNSVGFCDLRFLLKKGQSVLLQIFKRGDLALQKRKPLLAGKPHLMVKYTAYIGWVGNVRPSAENTFEVGSDDMLAYLSKCNLTLENFEAMRAGLFTHKGGKKNTQPTRKQSAKLMPLVDQRVNTNPEQGETAKRVTRRPTILDRLGTKSYPSTSGICGSCGKNDSADPNVIVGTNLIRAVLEVKSANDPKVDKLLKTQEEVDLAIKLTSVLSKALSKQFDMTQAQVQQIGHDLRSDHSSTSGQDFRSRSPHRDYRPRSPRQNYRPRSPKRDYRQGSPPRDYRSRSPKHDYRPRSPKRDCRSRSPIQNYRDRSPTERNHWEGRDNYYKEKNEIPNRADRERFDHGYSSANFSAPSNRGQSERSTHNYFVDDDDNGRLHHDYEKRPRDQDFPLHHHPSPQRSISSSARIVDPFASHHVEENQQIKAQSKSGPPSHRQIDEDYNDMLKWDVQRVDAEFQRLSEQYNKMKEMRDRTSSHSSTSREESSSNFAYRNNDDPRKPYESSRAKSPTLVRLMESEMKAKSNPKQAFGTNSVPKPASSYMEKFPRGNFHL